MNRVAFAVALVCLVQLASAEPDAFFARYLKLREDAYWLETNKLAEKILYDAVPQMSTKPPSKERTEYFDLLEKEFAKNVGFIDEPGYPLSLLRRMSSVKPEIANLALAKFHKEMFQRERKTTEQLNAQLLERSTQVVELQKQISDCQQLGQTLEQSQPQEESTRPVVAQVGIVEHTYEVIQDYKIPMANNAGIQLHKGDRHRGKIYADRVEILIQGVSFSVPRGVFYAQPKD